MSPGSPMTNTNPAPAGGPGRPWNVQVARHGGVGVLQVVDATLQEPAPGEIVILRPARKAVNLARSVRDERRNERVRRVLFRVPEHAKDEAPVA